LGIHKGFYQEEGMAKGVLPIRIEASSTQSQNAGTEIGSMSLGKDEKTAVISNQLEAAILKAEGPSDPTIPCRALPCAGGEAQQSQPLIAPEGHVPKGLADLGQRSQVMMGLDELLETRLFARTDGPDKDLLQIQKGYPRQSQTVVSYNSSGGVCPGSLLTLGFLRISRQE